MQVQKLCLTLDGHVCAYMNISIYLHLLSRLHLDAPACEECLVVQLTTKGRQRVAECDVS